MGTIFNGTFKSMKMAIERSEQPNDGDGNGNLRSPASGDCCSQHRHGGGYSSSAAGNYVPRPCHAAKGHYCPENDRSRIDHRRPR